VAASIPPYTKQHVEQGEVEYPIAGTRVSLESNVYARLVRSSRYSAKLSRNSFADIIE